MYTVDPPVDPPMEQPGAIVPVPPADVDAAHDDDGGLEGGGPLDDVDADGDDDPPEIEGVPLPNASRMSQRDNRAVPPLRLIEIMVATSEMDNGGASATYGEALQGPEGKGWQIAFDTEVKSLNDDEVYTVVDRPLKKKVVKAKWVLRRKVLPRGKLDKLKACIVASDAKGRD